MVYLYIDLNRYKFIQKKLTPLARIYELFDIDYKNARKILKSFDDYSPVFYDFLNKKCFLQIDGELFDNLCL